MNVLATVHKAKETQRHNRPMVDFETNNKSSREVHRDAHGLSTQAETISIATPTCAIREVMNVMLALEYFTEAGDLPCSRNPGHSHCHWRFVHIRGLMVL